jgi:peptidoglycan hydrolase-like protein with peptidoglycan-binding domain
MIIRRGDKGEMVTRLQKALAGAGYLSATSVDGIFGPGTEAAVIRFQSDHHLLPDGVFGSNSNDALPLQSIDAQSRSIDQDAAHAMTMAHAAHADGSLSPINIDDNGVLHGDGITYVQTERIQSLATPDGHIEGMLWHWTDTRSAGAVNLARRIIKKPGAGSCHLWIDRTGAMAQSGTAKQGTWHAGGESAATLIRDSQGQWMLCPPQLRGKTRSWGANSVLWGTELENVGEVRFFNGQWLGWPFRWDYRDADGNLVRPEVVPDNEVHATGATPPRGLHLYTDPQVDSATRVTAALVQRYGLTRASITWGHRDVDPARRTDPGDLWMTRDKSGKLIGGHLKTILDRVFGPEQ